MMLEEMTSLVDYTGEYRNGHCGYCKRDDSSHSHSMWAYKLAVKDYQSLINRGWRRSGKYCYKPNNMINCCPSYTIKCDALNFALTKSHKKTVKAMNNFLMNGIVKKNDDSVECTNESNNQEPNMHIDPRAEGDFQEIPKIVHKNIDEITKSDSKFEVKIPQSEPLASKSVSSLPETNAESISRSPRKKAKLLRIERAAAKLSQAGGSLDSIKTPSKNIVKTLEEYIEETPVHGVHKLKVITGKPELTEENFALYLKYQTIVHNDRRSTLSKNSFKRFLFDSPLKYVEVVGTAGYGLFHQQYWLDDKLIAVGVIDILPECVSSVYFFYDPDYSFLSLGTYGSLREIAFVRELNKTIPAIKYYYMGYYIHSCVKMRYKANYSPSYLLCPETYTWHILTNEILKKLDEHKYQRLHDNLEAIDEEIPTDNDLQLIYLIKEDGTLYQFKDYVLNHGFPNYQEVYNKLKEYAILVGPKTCNRMVVLNSI